jgi:dTDP-glucose 4,6-dehydratase
MGMKRVFITGAGGAIGLHVVAHLLDTTDWEIICTDSFKAEHKGYFDRLTTLKKNPRLSVIVHDLNAQFTTREIEKIGPIDYIINLASRSDVHNSIEDPIPFIRNNTELMLTMLQYARLAKPKVFLHFSTDEVYGPAPRHSKGHPEWDPILPSNPYSASKAMQEALAIAWWRSYDVPLIITNTMNNFGETQAPSKYPAMIQQKLEADELIDVHATSDGTYGTRYYLHSRNAADAILFILKNVAPIHHQPGSIDRPVRLNIVGDRQIDNLELVHIIARLMGKKPRIHTVNFHEHNPGHDLHYGLDGALLTKLGWKPPVSFETSMKYTIEWQKKHPEWMK